AQASFSFSNSVGSGQSQFLPVDEAFRFSSSVEPGALRLHWQIADGYYLYKERLQVKIVESGVVREDLKFFQPGTPKDDAYFGPVTVFYNELTLEQPIISTGGNDELTIQVTYQGCADAGLRYPPKTQPALYLNPAVAAANNQADNPDTQTSEPIQTQAQAQSTAQENRP